MTVANYTLGKQMLNLLVVDDLSTIFFILAF